MNKFEKAIVKANEIVISGLLEIQNAAVKLFFTKHKNNIGIAMLGLMLLFSFGMIDTVLASNPGEQVFARANTAMQGVLKQVRTISSIIAALFLTIAFLMKMLSKNQRTVDEANTWIKRIFIAWACINAVGFLLTFIQEVVGPDASLPTLGG